MFQAKSQRMQLPVRRLSLAVLLALCIAAEKPSQTPIPGADAAKKAASERPPFDLTYVPPNATGVIAVRPNAIFADPAMKPLARILKNMPMIDMLLFPYIPIAKLPMQEIEQVILYTTPVPNGKQGLAIATATIRATGDFNWLKLMRQLDPKTKELHAEDIVYYRSHLTNPFLKRELKSYSGADVCYLLPDKRSLVPLYIPPALSEFRKSNFKSKIGVRPHFSWDNEWKHVERDIIAYAQDNRHESSASKKQTDDPFPEWDALFQKTTTLVAGIKWKDGIDLQAYLIGKDRAAGDQLVKNIKSMMAVLRRDMEQASKDVPEAAREATALNLQIYKDLVEQANIQQRESTVCVHTKAKINLADLPKYFLLMQGGPPK